MIKDGKLLVNEIFESIDGEGYHSGYPTVFFRTTGCNLRCTWCDSKYTFESEDSSEWLSVEEAYLRVTEFRINHITITGGEPLMEENKIWMSNFIRLLLENDFTVDVETNGSIDYSYWKEQFGKKSFHLIMDWKCPSSKMNNLMIANNLKVLDEKDIVKIVVQDEDFEEVEKILKSNIYAQIYISPVFEKVTMERIPQIVMKYKHKNNIRCQIQIHKIFWNPDQRGV